MAVAIIYIVTHCHKLETESRKPYSPFTIIVLYCIVLCYCVSVQRRFTYTKLAPDWEDLLPKNSLLSFTGK